MSITMRISDAEKRIIQECAELYGLSISEYIRKTVMEKIEDEYDLKCYKEAMEEYNKNPKTYTHEELKKELGL